MKKIIIAFLIAFPLILLAEDNPVAVPDINLSLNGGDDPYAIVSSIKIILLLTLLAIAPTILLTMTSFTRVLIVFHFLRQAMGTQQTPSNQILIPLALFMTFFIMRPIFLEINESAVKPYMNDEINQEMFFEKAAAPLKKFMLSHTRKKDLALFVKMSDGKKPENADDISFFTVVPSFMISELKTAFQIGFLIYLPFFILDISTATILMSLGMMMLPPIIISLPIKLVIFVLADGWHLIVSSLLQSF
ncbi:MAG: flagellar type III secretion system pore protein FliP [bacterium]